MPGTLSINQAETFSAAPIVMSIGPKNEFGTETQQITRDGERKWLVQAAVQYKPENGMRAVAEVIEVTLTGGDDPSRSIAPGTPVEFQNLRAGISAPEQRQRNDGGTRITGGRLWWTAMGLRPVQAAKPAATTAA